MVQKVQVKLFSNANADVEGYVPVLHRWIRDNVLGELVIDVVDYSHVADGPEVVLIGHASDYAIDRGGGKLGLLYSNKREPESDDAFTAALAKALRAASLLEREEGPKQKLAFRTDELVLRVADRLNAPNTDATLTELQPKLRAALDRVYGAGTYELARVGTPKELFGVLVRAKSSASVGELLARVS